jgi:hypothetical protein
MNQILFVLLLVLQGMAAVIHVPEDQPTVQQGLDATAPGDTVLVARGTYQELLTSPDHSFTLCSNFLFTQDSTDIVETVLDGNHDGTILSILLNDGESASVQGLTFWRGMGQDFGGAYHLSAGAINLATVLGEERVIDLEVSNCVFRENYSENGVSILYVGGDAGWPTRGRLVLSRLHFLGNEDPVDSIYESMILMTRHSPEVLFEDWVFDAGVSSNDLLYAYNGWTDSIVARNIILLDGDRGGFHITDVPNIGHAPLFENIRTVCTNGLGGSRIGFAIASLEENHDAVCRIRNIEVDGTGWGGLFIQGNENGPRLDIDGLHLHNITGPGVLGGSGNGLHGVLRNLHVHDNVVGDSTSLFGSIVSFGGVDIYDAHIHDNTVIIPPHPNPGGTGAGGNHLDGPILWTSSSYLGEPLHFENITLEKNTVIDLDDYSDPFPEYVYRENIAREFHFVLDWDDTTYVKNITIRHSRQPNHCPEIYIPENFEKSNPGYVMGQYARHLVAENLLLEDCDDGGLLAGGASVSLDNVVLRNVARVGLLMGDGIARNVLIDGTVAKDDWLHLTPGFENLTYQAAIFRTDVVNVFENLTIMNCDSMRALIQESSYSGSEPLVFRNAIIAGNQYDYLFEDIDASRITWDHCYVQEAVPGEGNIIGQDPLFDPELGPPFLSPDSPCIDAGNPESVYNDVEDADNPGWARWPSQGGLRNDIGFFGGPGVDSLAADWLPVRLHEEMVQPNCFTLGDPYPNPFNPVTRIPFTLESTSRVTMRVYNLRGQLIRHVGSSLFGGTYYSAGRHELELDGSRLASGVYVVEIQAGELREARKVVLLR